MSTRKQYFDLLVVSGLILCGQAVLAGPPGVPHYNANSRPAATPAPAVHTEPFADRTKDKYKFVKTDARRMGLTEEELARYRKNGDRYVPDPQTKTGRRGTSAGDKRTANNNLNTVYDVPTYDLNAHKKSK